jgi:hypothetical protein
MTGAEIITKFELYMDDTTELSADEELDLVNKIYQRVSEMLPWEQLKKAYSGTASGTTLALPTRFSHIVENYNYSSDAEYGGAPVVFIGTEYQPYKLISWSDRRRYREHSGHAYVDIANSNLVFTVDPGAKAVEYDYIEYPADLATGTSPWFPSRFHDAIYHGMCVDDFVIQQSEKAKSYRGEHQKAFEDYIADMKLWNARLVQMT